MRMDTTWRQDGELIKTNTGLEDTNGYKPSAELILYCYKHDRYLNDG